MSEELLVLQVDWGIVDDLEALVDVHVNGVESVLEVARPVEEGGVRVQFSQVHLVVQLLLVAPEGQRESGKLTRY